MKKLLLSILMLITPVVFAQTVVPSIWAFNIANVQGSYYRAILEQANENQKKYQFIPEHKPGAAGSIGAAYVENSPNLALLGTAAAYFIRPNLYSAPGYSFDQFKPVHVMAQSPVALTTKDKDLASILKQDKISIGTAGPGSGTHLFALKFKEYYPTKNIIIVPYKSSTEALQDVLGGHTDLAFEFLGDAEAKGVRILGVTGHTKIKNYPLLKDTGYPSLADMVGVYLILVKKDVPDEKVAELRNIFVEAEKSSKVQELYKSDYSFKPAQPLKTSVDYQRWYTDTINFYKKITAGQQVE